MSILKEIKEVLRSKSKKRRKTGVGEDDWCDALNDLSVDSSSSEEYVDAQEDLKRKRKRKIFTWKRTTNEKSSESSKMPFPKQPGARPAALQAIRRREPGSGSSSFTGTNIIGGSKLGKTGEDTGLNVVSECIASGSSSNPSRTGASEVHRGGSWGSNVGMSSYGSGNSRNSGSSCRHKLDPGTSSSSSSWHHHSKCSDHSIPKSDVTISRSPSKSSTDRITPQTSQKRKISITLMTSSQLFTIEGLKKKLQKFRQSRSDLIKEVRVLQLPYSRIQYYTFTEPVDVMILCHSIDNRRFAITNVTDSLYDAFLDYCNKELGKERISVIAHDFPPEDEKVRKTKMDTFKHTQYSTFENAGLVMICGMLDKEPEIKEQDWDSLVKFLEAASRSNPDKADTSPTPPAEKHTQPSPSKPSKSETANKKNGKSSRMLPGPGKAIAMRFRKPVIYVCTSWGLNSVKGFKEHLQALISRSFIGCEIQELELPYSGLKDFKFPSEVDKRDAMILCHSVDNRGFSVTDVPNSIYDEYLAYCNRLFGKNHVAVIVHDFEYRPEILNVHINTFRRGQPKTFELAKFIALAGRLDVPDVHLVHDDSQSLETFVKGLR